MLASFDLETHLATRGVTCPRIVSGSLAIEAQAPRIMLREDAIETFRELCADSSITILGQYIASDISWMLHARAHDLVCIRAVFDALKAGRIVGIDIAQMLLDAAADRLDYRTTEGYSLPNIARWNGFASEDKDENHPWRKHYAQLDGVPPERWPAGAREYVLSDAAMPLTVAQKQLAENAAWQQQHGYGLLHQAGAQTWSQVSLELIGAHGVYAHPERVARLRQTVDTEINELARTLRHEPGCAKPDRNPAVADATCCSGCLRPLSDDPFAAPAPLLRWKKEKGAWRLSRDTKIATARMLAACARRGRSPLLTDGGRSGRKKPQLNEDACILSGDPILVAYADYASSDTLRARVEDLEQATGPYPLQGSYRTILVTGRTSSSKPREPQCGTQMQNWPRVAGARECLTPRRFWDPLTEQWVEGAFLWADVEAAEMHTLAQSCRDLFGYSRLGELLLAGVDPHAYFGGIAFMGGMSVDEVLKHPDKKTIRNKAKPVNFGKPGGMGHEKWVLFARKQYGQLFTLDEAAHYGKLWFSLYPEVKDLHRYVGQLTKHGPCVLRLPRGSFAAGGKTFTAACNFFFQAPTAAAVKAGMCHVLYECFADPTSPLFGFRVWNMVHDELCLEGPTPRVHAAGVRLAEIMKREFDVLTPDYPVSIDVIAGDTWSKDAKTVRNEKGELQLWRYQMAT